MNFLTDNKGLFLSALLLSLACLGVFAQNSPSSPSHEDWYYGKTVRKIEYAGLDNIRKSDVEAVTKQFIGKEFSDELYSEILSRLDALDFFDDITPEILSMSGRAGSVLLRFTVVEKPIVGKLLFIGNTQVRSQEIRDTISTKEKDVFNAARVLSDERAVRDLYLKKGFTDVSVSSRTPSGKTGIEITFVITEGVPTLVSDISFQGNTLVPDRTLRRQITTRETAFLRKGYFQEYQLELDRQALLTYYQSMGYVDAAVSEVQRQTSYNEKTKENDVSILFVIREGNQYTFGGVTFQGNRLFATERLTALFTLKQGAVFNQTRFQGSVQAVVDLYHENGYTANTFNPEVSKNEASQVISCTFTIQERERSHIERIVVQGNDKTKDYVITREIPLESGDIFSKTKVQNGLRNLYNLQFFSAIVPDIVPGSEDNLVDLVINVEEQSTTSVEFGLTFAGVTDPDDFPLSLFVKLQDSNIGGTGKTGSINTTLSPAQQSLSLGYGDSWLLGKPMSVSVSADISHRNLTTLQNLYFPSNNSSSGISKDSSNYYMNYEQLVISLSGGLGRRWFPTWAMFGLSGGVSFRLVQNYYDYDLFEPYDSTIARYKGTFHPQNSLYGQASLDDRDLSYDPSRGWFASERLTWNGLLPVDIGGLPKEEEFFLRSETVLEGYVTLFDFPVSDSWHFKWVLADIAKASFLFPLENYPIGETSKLYIDGMFNGRGWGNLYLTHRGEAMVYNTTEIRMPLVPGILALDFFFDAIAVKEKAADLGTIALDDLFFSYGPGLRFSIAQFPLRFLLANTFQIKDGKVAWRNGRGPDWRFVLSFNIANR